MPFPNEHSGRLKDPDQFDRIRRENDKFGSGIDVIWGVKNNKSEIQAIRFDAKKFSASEAKKWLADHDHKTISFEPATGVKESMSFKDYMNEQNENDNLGILGIRELKDGLELEDIQKNPHWHWVIMAGIKDAVIGKKGNKLVWYNGTWVLGTWNEKFAIWKKGEWKGGLDSKGNAHNDTPNKW
jgi:hypothetical protein